MMSESSPAVTMVNFEHTHRLSQAEYVGIWALLDPARPARLVRRIGILVVGLACLLSPYTMLLGVIILALAAVAALIPSFFPGTAARSFRQFCYLDGPVTYGADEDSVWVRTLDFSAKAAWRHVTVWRERNGWLILQGNTFPPVLLPITALKAQSIYDQVKALAQKHAVEWNRAGRREPIL
jgi:hypothetical protein